MKNVQKRVLVCLLMLAMLVPMFSTAVGPALAATTSGYIGNMDTSLTKNLIAPAEEATLNMENGGGIRFATNINLEKYAELKQFCKQRRIKGVSVGTLIAPLDYVKEAGEFSTMALGFLDYKTPYLDVRANSEDFYDGEKTVAEGYDEQFVGSIVNIKLENRDRKFAAIGYVQLTLVSGDFFTIYSYDNQNMSLVEKYATTLAEVAAKALQKDDWSAEERAKIEDLADATPEKVAVGSTVVTDFRYTRSQVYFTYKKGTQLFYNRITYNGANGWRLQTNTKSYNHFKDIGAGQSLSLYLDEGFNDVETPLRVVATEDVPTSSITIYAEGYEGSSVKLSCNYFSLDFKNGNEALYNVNEMSLSSKGDIVLKGQMNATDAVYGGGERFDSANKRGKTLSLYISDSYDTKNGNGSYVAIPLFSTSRGGGMFVNRYEPMSISFPKKDEVGQWSLTIGTEILDCYFYATGNIADVLRAYTDMTGHASLPEEWAQGYLVCRFQPDFTSLGGLTGEGNGVTWYYNTTDIPNYNTFYYSATVYEPLGSDTSLEPGAVITTSNGNVTLYTYIEDGGQCYFESPNGTRYSSYNDLPDADLCHYQTKASIPLTADAKLPHKKALTKGSTIYYHYIIEDGTQDFNYNGILNESYYLRTSTKGGTAGAGVTYIVQSLIDAGMKPNGVILEGVSWYNMAKDAVQWANLKKFVDYLDSQGIKTLVYSYMAYMTGGAMEKNFKSEYQLKVNIYKYDEAKGIQEKIKTTTSIPKSDKTDNPDTVSDGVQTYLDITNPAAVKWYMDKVWNEMMELGIDGVKVDFCESFPNEGVYKNMKVDGVLYPQVYMEFEWTDPTMFEDAEPHHAYPSYFVSAFYKAMEEKAAQRDGDTGFVLITRGGGIGAQRNPYLWAGDQTRRFANLRTQLAAVVNSGLSGIPFMTYDMAGYAYHGTAYHFYGGQPQTLPEENGKLSLPNLQAAEEYESEIFVRSLQYTVFGNLIQTHGDVRHIYQMTDEAQELAELYNALHEDLATYLQKMSKIACDTGMPMVRHMVLEYQNDSKVADIDDQFMYGDALLVAPILTCNVKVQNGQLVLDYASTVTREVYLPAGEWIDLNTGEKITSVGQIITVDANLAKIPVYLNTASEYAEELQVVFAGEAWTAIKALANAQ